MKKNYLVKLFYVLFVFTILSNFYSYSGGGNSGGGGGGGGKNGPGCTKNCGTPTTCTTITKKACSLSLSFPFTYPNRGCNQIPEPFSDYRTQIGANTLSAQGFYYCKITIEPNVDISCYTPSDFVFYWTSPSQTLNIQVPNEVTSKMTVEYYERCGTCNTNVAGNHRPYFRYSTTLTAAQSNVTAILQYMNYIFC